MQIICEADKIISEDPTAIAVGKFDGMHRGHQELLHRLIAQKKTGLKSVVFTFDPAPEVYFGWSENKVLLTRSEKNMLFAQMGFDVLIYYPMNSQTVSVTADSFLKDILSDRLKMSYICAGEDLTFGGGGKGNTRMLTDAAALYGYQADVIGKIMYGDREISSSYIKEAVNKGNLPLAAELLGHHYWMSGTVVAGERIGRTLGMPTLNLLPEPDKILPPCGVYYTVTTVGSNRYPGLTNVGFKPTVSDRHELGAETYLYGFAGDLYGHEIQVEYLEYKRPEVRFAGAEALKEQLQRDIGEGKVYFRLDSRAEVDYN